MSRLSVLLCCTFAAMASAPVYAKEVTLRELGVGRMVAQVPDDWSGAPAPQSAPGASTIRFTGSEAGAFVVLITTLEPPAGANVPPPTPDAVREVIEYSAYQAQARAVESELAVTDFSGAGVFGSYFSATDRAPPPGEFTYMTQGTAAVGPVVVTFTALSREKPDAVRDAALDVIRSLKLQTSD